MSATAVAELVSDLGDRLRIYISRGLVDDTQALFVQLCAEWDVVFWPSGENHPRGEILLDTMTDEYLAA
jgi:hypothetical protein